MEQHQNTQLRLAYDFVEHTSKSIFLTGKAGTGKTTFLHMLKKRSLKRMVVVAPTGVAAMNAGGVTIHSFFQIPFGPYVPGAPQQGGERQIRKFSKEKISIMRSLDLLVIDEISMVRADMLDAIDEVLRRYKDRQQPFGGVQLLMIGDLQQLAPVAKEEEWKLLRNHYSTVFFFGSLALQQTEYISIMLQHIYRQSDTTFIDILNGIRENKLSQPLLERLNSRCQPDFRPQATEGYITLTTHNYQAQQINERELRQLRGKEHRFEASIEGDFPEYTYPTEQQLLLKEGAQVMFVKNDTGREKRYYNGKIGTVKEIQEDLIVVESAGEEDPIYVEKTEWQNYKYSLDEQSKEIKETVAGVFRQYPLKLAWAITIHKSQGLTFDRAIIDANAAFTHGQVYVALSRCRSLEGLVLTQPLAPASIISDASIQGFNGQVARNQPGEQALQQARQSYQQRLLLELFDFNALARRLGYFGKLLREHAGSLAGNPAEVVGGLQQGFRMAVGEVSGKFLGQMGSLGLYEQLVEENTALQERIAKAAAYFAEKLELLLLQPLKQLSVETDNRELRKNLKQAFEALLQEALVKEASLKACRQGFVLHTYLEARAKASLEEVTLKPEKNSKEAAVYLSADHPALYKRLREYRDQKAAELGLPHYMVLPLKTLEELAAKQPGNLASLKKIKGLGKKKLEQMGEELLEIIHSLATGEAPAPAEAEEIKAPREKKAKVDSKLQTFELYKEGKSVAQISELRGIAPGTIEGHLAHYVAQGEIDIHVFVPRQTQEVIAEYYQLNGLTRLSEAKAALGEAASYFELRLMQQQLFPQEKKQLSAEKEA